MTVAADEGAQGGSGPFRDAVDVQVLDGSLLCAARIERVFEGGTRAVALVLDGDRLVVAVDEQSADAVEDWTGAAAGPLRLGIERPLERWTLALDSPAARIDLELRALTPPADLSEAATGGAARAAGLHGYTQLCRAEGAAEVAGRRRPIDAPALRSHRWSTDGGAGRARFVTAATEDGTLVSVAAVQPAAGSPHGEEIVAGQTLRAGADDPSGPLPFETVRLSTVYGEDGLPLKAGAELFRPGEELPSRLAGVAAGGMATAQDGGSLSLFRFRIDGIGALGAYEIQEGR